MAKCYHRCLGGVWDDALTLTLHFPEWNGTDVAAGWTPLFHQIMVIRIHFVNENTAHIGPHRWKWGEYMWLTRQLHHRLGQAHPSVGLFSSQKERQTDIVNFGNYVVSTATKMWFSLIQSSKYKYHVVRDHFRLTKNTEHQQSLRRLNLELFSTAPLTVGCSTERAEFAS